MYTDKVPVSCYITGCTEPYRNLAVERYLLEHTPAGSVTLYLWQNKNTVVIGRNQNPWAECNMAQLRRDGGHLVRRLSGGGAVYHDSGNLNFTFLTDARTYNLARQLEVITGALKSLGINAVKSGRNDILVDGRKVSGNAFYTSGGKKYHHGTLLIDVKTDEMAKYLTVSPLKLQAKGVSSVKSRVLNLKEVCPSLTVPVLQKALVRSFAEIYGSEPQHLSEADFDAAEVARYEAEFKSDAFRLGTRLPFTWQAEARFEWAALRWRAALTAAKYRRRQFTPTPWNGKRLPVQGSFLKAARLRRRHWRRQHKKLPGRQETTSVNF